MKPPEAELRCSFCNKDQNDVRKLIAGPNVFICDQCVSICIDILHDDRRATGEEAADIAKRREASGWAGPPAEVWPPSDAWCAFCGQVADLQTALMIENRTLLCGSCVNSIAAAATEAPRKGGRQELVRIEEQLRRAFEGEAWHGPSVMEALKDVTPEAAAPRPVAGAHGIWELVLHISATYRLVLRRLEGNGTQLTPEEDWPAVPEPTEANWSDAIQTLHDLNQRLRRAVLEFDAERLDQPLTSEPYSAYTQFIGVTQHDLYHAGQIALLKKMSRP